MPDEADLRAWRVLVRDRLPALPVEETRVADIEDELAQWLHDAAESAGVELCDEEAFEA